MLKKYFLILFTIGLIIYLPSLFGPFLWDDEDFVFANQYVKEFRLDKFFTDSVTAGRNKGSNYFRPIQLTSYAITQQIFGFNPFWFHLLNVLVHIGAACAVFGFFVTLQKWYSASKAKGQDKNSSSAFLVALLFLVHPVQTEAVSYISGLSDPLFVLFGFLSLIAFMFRDKRANMVPLSVLFFTLSILSKETGLVFLPILAFLYAIERFNFRKIASPAKSDLVGIAMTIWPYFVIAISYLAYHFTFINQTNIKAAWGNTAYANSLLVRLLTFVQNLFTYVGLLVFPKDLFMERDFTVALQTKILNPHLIIFVIVITAITAILWKLRNSLDFGRWKLTVFCFISFFLAFIPYTGVILINGIFYEHFLYLPLVFFFGFILSIAEGFILVIVIPVPDGTENRGEAILKRSLPRPRFLLKTGLAMTVGVILFLFVIRNIYRQFDWNDSNRFYSQTLKFAPNSVRIINGLGMAYADKGDFDEAISVYSSGVRLNSSVPNLYHNLANVLLAQGKIEEAEKNYLKAIEVDSTFIFSWSSLGKLYEQTGQSQKLEKLKEKFQVSSLNIH